MRSQGRGGTHPSPGPRIEYFYFNCDPKTRKTVTRDCQLQRMGGHHSIDINSRSTKITPWSLKSPRWVIEAMIDSRARSTMEAHKVQGDQGPQACRLPQNGSFWGRVCREQGGTHFEGPTKAMSPRVGRKYRRPFRVGCTREHGPCIYVGMTHRPRLLSRSAAC